MSVSKISINFGNLSAVGENAVVNTPRSLEACQIEGVSPEDLAQKPRGAFRRLNTPDDIVELRYSFNETKRQTLLNEVKQTWEALIKPISTQEGDSPTGKTDPGNLNSTRTSLNGDPMSSDYTKMEMIHDMEQYTRKKKEIVASTQQKEMDRLQKKLRYDVMVAKRTEEHLRSSEESQKILAERERLRSLEVKKRQDEINRRREEFEQAKKLQEIEERKEATQTFRLARAASLEKLEEIEKEKVETRKRQLELYAKREKFSLELEKKRAEELKIK
eukprot:CAMPEP_0115003020 /NCGR_PEP_ID=MMETSP0216-20121206/18346_1 /TAXON_ID=223996 /ORGANISM="Protocruzia adherens, Strain Boccale" /LENGTH=274 /DNA_ID=CAMNT_0002368713 /DNA_START=26 /DNA_END=847 /DNA_ORIENTATION=-